MIQSVDPVDRISAHVDDLVPYNSLHDSARTETAVGNPAGGKSCHVAGKRPGS